MRGVRTPTEAVRVRRLAATIALILTFPATTACDPAVLGGPGTVRRTDLSIVLAVQPEAGGTVSVSPHRTRYTAGETVTLAAVPAAGFRFDRWAGDLSGSRAEVELTVESLLSATAHFAPAAYRLDITVDGQGRVELVAGAETAAPGETVELVAVPAPGHAFVGWTGLSEAETPEWGRALVSMTADREITARFLPNSLTILVYMNGDNDLEANLLEDIEEMRAADTAGTAIRVVALADRAPGYDTSDGDRQDTRLFEILPYRELASEELGLSLEAMEELNLGSPATLEAFLEFGRRAYPAPKTMLVIWGHGTGYRAGGFGPAGSSYRATSVDDSSASDALYTAELAEALEAARDTGARVDILGFDTCYGSHLEVYYEVWDLVAAAVATQGLTPADGWDYEDLLRRLASAERTERGAAETASWVGWSVGAASALIVDSYSAAHGSRPDVDIAAFDLSVIPDVVRALDGVSTTLYDAAAALDARSFIRSTLFSRVEGFYATPGDLAVDLGDMGRVIEAELDYADAQAAALTAAVDAARLASWAGSERSRVTGISVHLIPLDGSGSPTAHSDAYFKGSSVSHPLSFVADSAWVPVSPAGPGLLWRLWYEGAAE